MYSYTIVTWFTFKSDLGPCIQLCGYPKLTLFCKIRNFVRILFSGNFADTSFAKIKPSGNDKNSMSLLMYVNHAKVMNFLLGKYAF